MIESDALSEMIADAQQVPANAATPPTHIDLTALPRQLDRQTRHPAEIRIPESAAILLHDYELYVS